MSKHRVKIKCAAACSARLKYGTDPALAGASFTPAQNVTAPAFVADFRLDGLTAGTRYYAQLETNRGMVGQIMSFRAYPEAGAPASFSFATGSCSKSLSDGAVYAQMTAADPLFLLHMGDAFYEDPATASEDTFRSYYDAKWLVGYNNYKPLHFFRNTPIEYVWDNHDVYLSSDLARTALPAAQSVYRQYVPHSPLATTDGIYRAFTIGRVRFILTDLMSYKSPSSATDNASKSLLGTAQKAWFKQELLDAEPVHGCPLTLWVSSVPWIGTTGSGRWPNFTTERREIADFVKANGITGLHILSGDDHALQMDDGTNGDYATGGGAPIPMLGSAPLDRGENNVNTNGPWSEGRVASGSYFTLVTITDDGTAITMNWSGRQAADGAEVMALSFTIPTP